VMSLADFYNGKRVFVTGHTGFKGSWLCSWLKLMGSEVCGYALEPNTDPSLFRILELETRVKSVIADIRDHEKLDAVISEFDPEIVFHLAAQPLVRRSYKEPKLTFETNVLGTVNLLEAARSLESIRSFVNITTDKCYENREWVWGYRETDAMGGHDPYSSSKGCSELVTSCYRASFFQNTDIALASARSGNVIGGGDWAEDRLIPDIVRSLVTDKELIIRNPKAVRPWQHVLEPLSGYLLLGRFLYEKGQQYAEPWNLGPHEIDSLCVEDVLRKFIEIWGKGSYKIESEGNPPETTLLRLDVSKALQKLGWRPQMTSEEAIGRTIEWYKQFYADQEAAKSLLEKQIREYEEKLGEAGA